MTQQPPKRLPSAERREQFFLAALELFAEKGYHETRVDDVAARAGLSKGSLYHHFEGKRDLMLGLLDHVMAGLNGQLAAVAATARSAEAAVRSMTAAFTGLLEEQPALLGGLTALYALASRDEEVRRVFLGYYDELVDLGAALLRQGQTSGELRDDFDAREVAWAVFTAGDGLYLLHLNLGLAERAVPAFTTLLDICLIGLRAPGRGAPVGRDGGAAPHPLSHDTGDAGGATGHRTGTGQGADTGGAGEEGAT